MRFDYFQKIRPAHLVWANRILDRIANEEQLRAALDRFFPTRHFPANVRHRRFVEEFLLSEYRRRQGAPK